MFILKFYCNRKEDDKYLQFCSSLANHKVLYKFSRILQQSTLAIAKFVFLMEHNFYPQSNLPFSNEYITMSNTDALHSTSSICYT